MTKPERSVYTSQDFLQWRETNTLDLTPKFQRRGVWKPAARSYFIDSLLRQMPVPPIYIRSSQSEDRKRVIRQVIDGQQRISSVLDFLDGNLRLSRTLNASWAGHTFDDLSEAEKTRITTYSFSSEIFQGISDLEVLEVFARLNTYSVPLNAQELRNGKYFGRFKHTAYTLAYEHLEFWRRHGIFSERSLARMLEVELTSELIIAELDGMQDKKKSIEDFYERYDERFPQRSTVRAQFREVIDIVNDTFEDSLKTTEFHRPPLFYTLFCTVFHRVSGLPHCRIGTPKRVPTRQERLGLIESVGKLSELIASARTHEPIPHKYERFVTACLRQTDNIKPREERLRVVYENAFGG
jgi:Protein of unknown function DUF262